MKCPNCGKEVLEGAYKCVGCGKPLVAGPAAALQPKPKALCPHCQKEILAGSSKCQHCGKTIKHGAAAPVNAPAPPSTTSTADPNKCPKCGKPVTPEKIYCGSCGTKLSRVPVVQPIPVEDLPEAPELTNLALGLSVGSVATALVADLAHLLTGSLTAGLIVALVSIAMGGISLIKTRMKAPPWVLGLSISGILLSLLSLFFPRVALYFLIVFIGVSLFFAFKAYLGRKLGKTAAASIAFLVGFAFMTVGGFVGESVFGLFVDTPPTDEAKVNLTQFQIIQRLYLAQNRKYAVTFDELGWKPTPLKNYAYYLGPDQSIQPEGKKIPLPKGVNSFVSEGGYQLIAVGNIDKDDTPDVWSVQSDFPLEHLVNDVQN
jgi:DNA-directed RNA polymerase subunit RPC12/RpoP